jgi:pimeloyl-ACP methyl ester carboxylesterase
MRFAVLLASLVLLHGIADAKPTLAKAKPVKAKPAKAKPVKPPPPAWEQLPMPPAMPVANDSGFVESAGASIYYARYGTPTGAPVILLHGGMGNSDHWANQVPALAAKLHVIVIDSRGHGRSTRPKNPAKSPPSYDQMADDVLAVMDHLKLSKASLVGWSDGGEIAMKLAIGHATRVDKLFILGANYDAKGSKPRSGKPSQTFQLYGKRCRADYVRMSKTPKDYDDVVRWLLPIWRNPMGFTQDQLRSIQAPTMVADGAHDEIIQLDQIKEMATLIPHASLHVFEDASHFVLWQAPDPLSQVLVAFLTKPPS